MPKPCLTVADQILWEQRIQKEEINVRARNDFSVRNAVSIPNVPAKFKPGHLDPSDGTFGTDFDPKKVGWDPQGTLTKEFRRCISMQSAGPRERHQFPQTMGQEIGWIQARSGAAAERAEPSGSNPSVLGLGWVQKDGHGGLLGKAMEGISIDPRKLEPPPPPPRCPRDGSGRKERGGPPFADSLADNDFVAYIAAREAEARRRGAKDSGAVPAGGGLALTDFVAYVASREAAEAERQGGGGHHAAPSARASERSAKTRSSKARSSKARSRRAAAAQAPPAPPEKLARATSLPQLGADNLRQFEAQESALGGAMEQSRRFLNRQGASRWYHPLSNSDVATFADAYTKSWGVQLYAKAK